MRLLIRYTTIILEASVVIMLAIMSCLVLLNVVLRYGFNSSIIITEELARYLFIWIIFMGSMLAFKENSHIHIDVFIAKLSDKKQQVVAISTDVIMIICCYLLFIGSYQQVILNMNNVSPISGISIGINFIASLIMSAYIGILLVSRCLFHLHFLLRGR